MIRLENRLFGTRPIVAHCPGPLHDGWRLFADTVFAVPVASRPPRESATILTWNHGDRPDKPNGGLERCVARYGYEVQALGRGIEPFSFQMKLRLTADACRHLSSEFVMGFDSGDVLLVDHPDEVVSRFRRNFACDLLFNATGSRCWPELPQFVMFETSLPGAEISQGRCWLNAGAFVGRTEFCRHYFQTLADEVERLGFPDDQFAIKATWPNWFPRVQIDDRCRIFQWFNESRQVMQIERPRADRQLQLIEWLRDLSPLRFGAEVGVFDGYTSDVLLQAFPDVLLWMIDRWEPFAGPKIHDHLGAEGYEFLRRQALWWTSHAEERRFELRLESTAAARLFPDQSLDFAFIDADHTYDAVRNDLRAWWGKVRPGGFLCGHDYGVYGDATGEWGVSRAVDEFAREQQRNVTVGLDGTWRLVR